MAKRPIHQDGETLPQLAAQLQFNRRSYTGGSLSKSLRRKLVPIANAHENGDEDARESTATTSVDVKEIDDIELDTRSPLERFRVPPKKALSVTDLISPAWCELQYFYTLSKHGKKKRTPAMKQGTKIHKQLENEVHTTYPVTVLTREDGWGLRLWNVIQSLRTLEETGRTREMEIWGLVEGEFVNGVVDELGYQNPDPKGENAAAKLLPEDQKTITEYLTKHAGGHDITTAMNQDIADPKKSPIAAHSSAISCEKVIYLTDIKTRASRSIPDTASTLPTQFQLFLYHHFIEQLALGRFPLQAVADRYELDVDATFSDEFIAQVGGLNDVYIDAMSTQNSGSSFLDASQTSMDLLLNHNSLSSLWELLMSYVQHVFVQPSSENSSTQQLRLSPILTASYLSSETSDLIGHKFFQFDQELLDTYLREGMRWWRGERPAQGVALTEVARKCRWCDFRDDCEWLQERDLDNLRKARERWRERESPSVV